MKFYPSKKKILGFSDSHSVFVPNWRDPDFFNLMIELSEISNPTIYYIGAASGDDAKRINAFHEMASRCQFQPRVFRVFEMQTDNPKEYFKDADIIFIDGGATRNLIALLNEWNVIPALVSAYESGVMLAGASAGISMLFNWCITDSIKSDIRPMAGIGLLKGAVCVHYDIRPDRQQVLQSLIRAEASALPALAFCDATAVLFENEHLSRTFSIEPGATVYEFVTEDQKIDHLPRRIDAANKLNPQKNMAKS